MQTKRITAGLAVKDAAQGLIEAVVGTTGVKDLDGDVIEVGAVGEQSALVSGFNHSATREALPVGQARVFERGTELRASAKLFLDTTGGSDLYAVLKEMGPEMQWSIAFRVLDRVEPTQEDRRQGIKRRLTRIKLLETSPVLAAAGVGTRTVSVKCDSCAAKVGDHADPNDAGAALIVKGRQALDAAERFLRGEAPGPGSPGYVAQPDREAEALAAFAVHAGHAVLGYPGRTESPGVAWLKDGRLAGAYRPGAHHVQLALGLRGRRLVSTALHEVAHLNQHANHKSFDEFDADVFAKTWTAAVLAAWRMSDHGRRHVLHKKTGPPWPDPVSEAAVVLHAGWAYTFNPFAAGSAWSGVR